MSDKMEDTWNRVFNFNNDPNVNKLKNLYSMPSFFEILGIDRIEALHSNFIAWLLGNKQLGIDPSDNSMIRFLDVVINNNYVQKALDIDAELINGLASRKLRINDVYVDKEVAYKDQENNHRIDLIVTCDINVNNKDKELVLYIENKVSAPKTYNIKESAYQTQIYYDQYINEDAGQIQLFIFISPFENATCDCEKFVKISYNDLLLNVLEPIVQIPSINERDRIFLKEYIRGLGMQVLKSHNMGFIMAITNEEKTAFQKIYEKYGALFGDSLAAKISYQYKHSSPHTINKWKDDLSGIGLEYQENPNEQLVAFWDNNCSFIKNAIILSDIENKECILKMIADVLKDRTKYTLSYKGKKVICNKSHLAKRLVEAYIAINNINNTNEDIKSLQDFFSNIREPFILLNKPANEKLYDEVNIGNTPVWIPNGVWSQGSKHFEKLLEKSKDIKGLTID